MSVQGSFAAIAREDGRAALVTAVRGPRAGSRVLVRADSEPEGTLGDASLDAEAVAHAEELMWAERSELRGDLFVDVTAPAPRLIVFGAVEYAVHLAHFARVAGWRSFVIDPRARFATPERFPDAVAVIAAWPEPALAELGAIDRATYLVVLTHDPKLDDAALLLALHAEPAYIGAMGSRRAQAERRERLMAAGMTEAELARISAPVGLDLGGVTSEETALSIMAELVAVRYGRDGGRLSQRGGRIHEVGA
ncbi:MAG: XdhC/CoxI family protein [Actinomycetota bacterium]|nr:XdhC/CoxI family protein [Actinomycetota bacterium]